MFWKISPVVLLSAFFLTGCGKDDESTSSAPPPPSAVDNVIVHPTTQELISGPRSALSIKFAPFTLQVPMGWEVKSYNEGAQVSIVGKTPTDEVAIAVPVNHSITVDQEKSLEKHAKQDQADHPDLLSKVGIRDISGAKVIEQLVVNEPTTGPSTQPIQIVGWTYTVCIPTSDAKEFTAYELRFLGMTLQHYKADQAFLRPIIDSLTYTPTTDTLDTMPK